MADQPSLDAARSSPSATKKTAPPAELPPETAVDDEDTQLDTDDNSTEGLLTNKKTRFSIRRPRRKDWLRPYWLGFGLFTILFAFWLLDSLKDPVFALLVDGNLDKHQPPAKLCSVASTLALVCLLEFLSNARKKQQEERRRSDQDILDPGGRWTRMGMEQREEATSKDDRVPVSTFAFVGISYACVFSFLAYVLRFHPSVSGDESEASSTPWHILGYVLYGTIESFGSISVATFWSYTNSTLSLQDAESFYGLIVAIAQLGAIGGSSMVTTQYWSTTTLILLANLVIILEIVVMTAYARRFAPTAVPEPPTPETIEASSNQPVFWSGIYLILRHNYVLLILGVSCLYEVSLTCLDYQMKLLGWYRFEESSLDNMSFTQFMGRYGQLTNITSLVFSYFAFPFLIRKYGLRITLRLFPTLLLIATIVAYGALPGNLAVLFISLAVLKAMTYSIHDPSKELLYLPTSNSIKFRAKFWIDVVGARMAKAVGSSINTFAGSVDRSVRVGTIPSLLTASALWLACYLAGKQFDRLIESGTIVGYNDESGTTVSTKDGYSRVTTREKDGDLEELQVGLIVDEDEEGDGEDSNDTSTVELTPLK